MKHSQKVNEVAQVVAKIANYYEVEPELVWGNKKSVGRPVVYAREVLWYHLHKCGFSQKQLARIANKSTDFIGRAIKRASSSRMIRDGDMIRDLPKVSSSLAIEHLER